MVNIGEMKDNTFSKSIVKDSGKEAQLNSAIPAGEYEVLRLVDICYGDPTDVGKHGLKFKVCSLIHFLLFVFKIFNAFYFTLESGLGVQMSQATCELPKLGLTAIELK